MLCFLAVDPEYSDRVQQLMEITGWCAEQIFESMKLTQTAMETDYLRGGSLGRMGIKPVFEVFL